MPDITITEQDPLASLQAVLAKIDASLAERSGKPPAGPGGDAGSPTVAGRRAAGHWERNLAALSVTQPAAAAALKDVAMPSLRWLLGRDGSLTAQDQGGRWWDGTSLPLRVARSMMKDMEGKGTVSCQLAPGTAGQMRAALERLKAENALMVLLPQWESAAVALHCDDFSEEIANERMFFACGPQWSGAMEQIFIDHPGLPLPEQYVRTNLLDPQAQAEMIGEADAVIARIKAHRERVLAEIEAKVTGANAAGAKTVETAGATAGPICVIAGSRLHLWDLAGLALAQVLEAEPAFVRLDTDRPVNSGPLAMAGAVSGCAAVVAADVYRGFVPAMSPAATPWITWVTHLPIAPASSAAASDRLLLADPAFAEAAREAGWSTERLDIATWPSLVPGEPAVGERYVAMIGDGTRWPVPSGVKQYSSHVALWDAIVEELGRLPLAVGSDPAAYLAYGASRLGIQLEQLDQQAFIHRLILPQWRRGVAQMLAKAGLRVKCFGPGWEDISGCHVGGDVTTLSELAAAAGGAAAIVHPMPGGGAHPVTGLGRAIVHGTGTERQWIAQAKTALGGTAARARAPLSAGRVASCIGCFGERDADGAMGAD